MGASRRARRRRGPAAGQAAGGAPRGRSGWRGRVDAFGGPLVVLALGGAIVLIVALAVWARPRGASDEPLLGEAIENPAATHVERSSEVVSRPGEPPTGGPHFVGTVPAGVYDEPVSEGLAVHSLEHGMVWISYNPELVSEDTVAGLKDLAGDHGRDVILSPRPSNEMPIALVSWDRLLRMDELDRDLANEFVRTNRDRSPEPGVR